MRLGAGSGNKQTFGGKAARCTYLTLSECLKGSSTNRVEQATDASIVVSSMGWNRRYAIVSYLRSSLWTVPLVALVVEQIGIRFLTFIDQSLQWMPAVEVTAEEAGDTLATIASLTIAFLVFTFGSMLVALQVASAQLTPRIIATTLLRDNTIRFTVGLFVFTLLLSVGTKARLHDPLPLAMVTVAIVAGIGSMAAFLFLIDYTARLLRPTAICQARGRARHGGDRGSLSRRHRAPVRTTAATADPIPTGKDSHP